MYGFYCLEQGEDYLLLCALLSQQPQQMSIDHITLPLPRAKPRKGSDVLDQAPQALAAG